MLTICAIITLVFGLLNIFVFSNHSEALDSDAFITTWKVSGDSDGRTVKIPVYKSSLADMLGYATYNYTIDWGDGSPIEAKSGYISPSHTYANDGEYDIKIEGDFPGMTFGVHPQHPNSSIYASSAFADYNDTAVQSMAKKIRSIKQWGKIKWRSMYSMFHHAENMVGEYTDSPDTSKVKSMERMFHGARKFNSPLNIDTRSVTNMEGMLRAAESFNQPINFNTPKLSNVANMFAGATSFNQPINFNTSNATNFGNMFKNATSFNQDISNLDFSVALKRGQYDDGMGDFASNSGLSIKNYDKILKNWHDAVKNDPSITFHHKPSSAGLKYCAATAEHDFLVGLGWTFNDTRDCGVAPQDINLSSNIIDENTPPNTKVADITMPSDPNDTPGDTNTASLTCATPGADDNAFTITNNKLYLKNPADYEAKNSYNICIRATDEYGNFLDKNFTININNNNELPVVTSTPITTATQGSPYSYTITASDPENAPLTFTASPSNPSWLHFNPSTHVVSGTPSQADAGKTFQVSFTISDGTNTIEHKYNITVSGNGNNQGGNNNQGGGNNGGHNGNQGGGNSGSAGGRGGSNVVNNYTHYHTHITNQNTRNSSNGSGGGSVTDSNPARSDSNNGSNVNDSNSDSSSNKDSNKSLKDKTISSSSHRGNNSSNCQCPVAGSSKKEKRSFFDMTIGELWWFWILIILILIGIIAYLVLRNRDREDEFKEKRVGF